MGRDKALIEIDGLSLARRAAETLEKVCSPAIEVGPGFSRLKSVREEPKLGGPLVALIAGAEALGREETHAGLLVLAVDMPLVSEKLLRFLAEAPRDRNVVPRTGGIPQPLCARYSRAALDEAESLVAYGERSVMALLDRIEVYWLEGEELLRVAPEGTLVDLDRPEEVERFSSLGYPNLPAR